ncbi:unnamed protein product, partial [Rotaria sordida]
AADKFKGSERIRVKMPAIVLLNPEDIGNLVRVLNPLDNSDEAVHWRERIFIVKIENDEYICKPRVIKPFDESDECNDSIADIPEYINARTKWRKEHGIIYDDISELASSDEQQLEAEDAIVNEISELTELEEERLQTGNKTATKIRALSTTSLSLITEIEVTIAPLSLSSLSVSGCSSSLTVIDEHADVIEDEELAIAVVAEKETTMRAKEAMEIALQAAKEAEETYKKVSMLKGKKRTKKTIIAQIDEIYTYETTYEPPLISFLIP